MEGRKVNCSILQHTEKEAKINIRLDRSISLLQKFCAVRVSKNVIEET